MGSINGRIKIKTHNILMHTSNMGGMQVMQHGGGLKLTQRSNIQVINNSQRMINNKVEIYYAKMFSMRYLDSF